MKHVAIVAPHFIPCNVASMHRARLLAAHLNEFGWSPSIITVDPKHHLEAADPELERLMPQGLEVRRSSAWKRGPLLPVGDIGVRGFTGMLSEIGRLHRQKPVDFLYVTIPSNFAAPLGRLASERWGIPYGIDYIDPWVHRWPGTEKKGSKAWWSLRIAEFLEPWSVARASLITGVAPGYYEGMLERNQGLRGRVVTAAMPYGWTPHDYGVLERYPKDPFLFEAGKRHLIYAGALLPKGMIVLERFFEGLRAWRGTVPAAVSGGVRVLFVGTGGSSVGSAGPVMPIAERWGVADLVREHPARIGYLAVLDHLRCAAAALVLGSTESHYSPSKCYQALLSGRPVLALLHQGSAAAELLSRSTAARCVFFPDGEAPDPSSVRARLSEVLSATPAEVRPEFDLLSPYSARASAAVLAEAMARALASGRRTP